MSRFDRVRYAGIALLVWIYLMSAIALIGCEFDVEFERSQCA